MSFDWKEYLNLAYFLSGRREKTYSPEGGYRSAVSRAYYAAFCYARNHARDNEGFKPSKSVEDHKKLRSHFRRNRKLEIASYLEDLRQWRNSCDYDDKVENLSQLLRSSLKTAEEIIYKLLK